MALAEYGNAFNIDTDANGDPILIDAQSGQTVATYDRTQSAWVYGDIISDSVSTEEANINGPLDAESATVEQIQTVGNDPVNTLYGTGNDYIPVGSRAYFPGERPTLSDTDGFTEISVPKHRINIANLGWDVKNVDPNIYVSFVGRAEGITADSLSVRIRSLDETSVDISNPGASEQFTSDISNSDPATIHWIEADVTGGSASFMQFTEIFYMEVDA